MYLSQVGTIGFSEPQWGTELTGNTCISGETVVVCGEERSEMCLTNPVPDFLCNGISGNTFQGGFLQGAYKLAGYQWQILETSGFAFEFVIQSGDTLCSGETLNGYFPENAGMFFYLGLKSADPYCGYDVSGLTSCDGISPTIPFTIVTDNGYSNDFLFYTRNNVCNPPEITKTVVFEDCCGETPNNALGFRWTPDNEIETILLTQSGTCTNGDGEWVSYVQKWVSPSILSAGKNHLVIGFTPYGGDCGSQGRLSFWVNGIRRYYIEDFGFSFRPLGIDKSLQIDIPYNISIGGGTLGNWLSPYNLLESTGVCVTEVSLSCDTIISGVTIDGYYHGFDTPLGIEDVDALDIELTKLFGEYVFVRRVDKTLSTLRITITTYKGLENYVGSNGDIVPTIIECISATPPEPCTIIEETFAGVFIGDIWCFRVYPSVTIQDISKMFKEKGEMFGIPKVNPCC